MAKNSQIFSIEDVLRETKFKRDVAKVLLYRLQKSGWIERIEKGKYMIIPLEGDKGEFTLHEFLIGSALVNPSCIAYWSALNHYGLTEQIPGTVYIQTTSRKKRQNIEIFGIKYKIIKIKPEKFFGTRKEWIEEMNVFITDKEKTVVDCLDQPHLAGGIIEIAKALKIGRFDHEKLLDYSSRIGNSGVVRRLGFLSQTLGLEFDLEPPKCKNYLFLDPTLPKKGPRSTRWGVIVNLPQNELEGLD